MGSMYDTLMQLPMFQGVSREKISDMIEKTKFHFQKYSPDETIVSEGEECTHLKFVVSGEVCATISNDTGFVRISQVMSAPNVLFPNYLFGRKTSFPGSIVAIDEVGIMQVDKLSFIALLQSEKIFLVNLMNILSARSQASIEGFRHMHNGDATEYLAYWIVSLTQRGAKDIKIEGKARDIYEFLGVTRSSFLSAIDYLTKQGLVCHSGSLLQVLDRNGIEQVLVNNRMILEE